MINKRVMLICLTLILTMVLTGCSTVDKALIKLGFRNTDFEYMVKNKVDKIIIQNSRDTGFRFIVTDDKAINDIYKILRNGKVTDKKSSLDPDYVFEVHMVGDEVKYYNYVVSVSDKGIGNFYNDDISYSVSSNLDDTILNNLEFIRKPKNFTDIYYNSILDVLKKNKKQLSDKNNKVGINISADVDCLKYMFSVDLEQFKKDIKKVIPNADLVSGDISNYDTVVTISNKGYSTNLFKTVITIDDKLNKSYVTYYVKGTYEYKNWDIDISEPDTKPSNW
ncbi:hypothetical protein KQI77_12815 [Clostridium sp. MSJ-8]|nr:hypothetical protein [Clostridium sp. MSJ-8]